MRAWLICTIHGQFYPVEEVLDEGGLQQSIELHTSRFNEEHRDHIRVFFPEMPTDVLDKREYNLLKHLTRFGTRDEFDGHLKAREVLDLYDNTIR
jgi:hypothetical protein